MISSMLPNETPQEVKEKFYSEKYSLRRFLVGITSTTFGVLVALHPNEYYSIAGRWCYVISVIFNAISLIFFIGGLFGRYWMLIEKGTNLDKQYAAAMQGVDYKPVEFKFTKIFSMLSILGLCFYLLAVLVACIFIVLEVLGNNSMI